MSLRTWFHFLWLYTQKGFFSFLPFPDIQVSISSFGEGRLGNSFWIYTFYAAISFLWTDVFWVWELTCIWAQGKDSAFSLAVTDISFLLMCSCFCFLVYIGQTMLLWTVHLSSTPKNTSDYEIFPWIFAIRAPWLPFGLQSLFENLHPACLDG